MKNISKWFGTNVFALLSVLSSLLAFWKPEISVLAVVVFGIVSIVQSSLHAKRAQKQIDDLKSQIESKANKPTVEGETLFLG